jgi:hypothetical protein
MQAAATPNEKRPGPGVIVLVVADEPKGDTQVRVRVVAKGWLGAKGRSTAGRVFSTAA